MLHQSRNIFCANREYAIGAHAVILACFTTYSERCFVAEAARFSAASNGRPLVICLSSVARASPHSHPGQNASKWIEKRASAVIFSDAQNKRVPCGMFHALF
jgi:hypothetical protein